MKIAFQIPIKARSSTRVPNKNFRDLCGKPFSCWLLDELANHCPSDWDLYIDSEDHSVYERFVERYGERYQFHLRPEWFASDAANGNHLLTQFVVSKPDYDVYCQAFVTAVTLPGSIIRESVEALATSMDRHDSMFLASEETGWYWFKDQALNYEPEIPDGLPRSQDAMVLKETTGLYAITRDAALRTNCRIGNTPLIYKVAKKYAFDVDTLEDFSEAQNILKEENANRSN